MAGPPARKAVFTSGSTMRHVIVMTGTASIGLVSIFFVDLINLLYISMLGQQALAAAIGYAATIMFFSVSICIGVAIAATAVVAKSLGAEQHERAQEQAASSLFFMVVISSIVAAIFWPLIGTFLDLLGATGETHEIALGFMRIIVPSIPLLGLGMCLSALLRARGDAKRAMYVTLSGGAVALVLDPLLIFGLDLGVSGAAIATVLVRVAITIVGFWGAHYVHRMIGRLRLERMRADIVPFFWIAIPAVATQLATPVGNAYVTGAISAFGDDAVAGWAIIGRLLPVAFGVIFALSGAVGPILSQNYGARLFDRVEQALRDALLFTLIYCLAVWALLAVLNSVIVGIFDASGDAASLVTIFNYAVCASFLFNGALFVANSSFNNLGNPIFATIFNWGRATLGVIPFVYVGKAWGAEGVLIGWGLGAVVFGIGAVLAAFWSLRQLPARAAREDAGTQPSYQPASAQSPFTSGKGASAG